MSVEQPLSDETRQAFYKLYVQWLEHLAREWKSFKRLIVKEGKEFAPKIEERYVEHIMEMLQSAKLAIIFGSRIHVSSYYWDKEKDVIVLVPNSIIDTEEKLVAFAGITRQLSDIIDLSKKLIIRMSKVIDLTGTEDRLKRAYKIVETEVRNAKEYVYSDGNRLVKITDTLNDLLDLIGIEKRGWE